MRESLSLLRFKRDWEPDAEEILEDEWECALRNEGRLGPASLLDTRDSGIDGSSLGDPGRGLSTGGRIGVLMEILREWG